MIKKLFAKFFDQKQHETLYDWKEISISELNNIPDGLNDMRLRNFDGVLIQQVLSHEECDLIIKAFDSLPQSDKKIMPEGETYPLVFAQLVRGMLFDKNFNFDDETFNEYFNKCASYNNSFKSVFKVDFRNKIELIFTALANGRTISLPRGIGGVGEYPFSTLRKLIPEKGDVSIHCGNYFQQEFPSFYKHLMTQVEVKDQLSYFVMLQEPEEGGELTLYDWIWKDGQTKDNPAENIEVVDENGNILKVSKIKLSKVRPRKGDMILFQGGSIWHRVELVKGLKSRYTIGGFMGFSHDDKEIIYWS